MRIEKSALIISLVAAALVLAVPFWRGLALSQFRQALPGQTRGVWAGHIDPSVPNPHPKSDAQLLKDRPNDFLLRVALAQEQADRLSEQTNGRRGQNAIETLMRDYPNKPIVYVLAASLPTYAKTTEVPRRMEGAGMTPEEAMKYWHKPAPPTPAQLDGVRRYVALMDKAIAADPGNGWFHYMKAAYLYGLHRDEEAAQEMHLSAIAPHFTDYADELVRASDHLYVLRGRFDPVGRSNNISAIRFPSLALARETARITAHLAYRDIRQGDTDQGVRTALDLTTSGYNMARNAPTLIQSLVGKAILAIGARALDPNFDSKAKRIEAQRAASLAAYKRFLIGHGYQREAAVLDRQWRQTERMVKKMHRFLETTEVDINAFERYYATFAASASVLTTLLLAAIAWGVASLLTAKGGARELWDRRSGITSALLTALVLVPLGIGLVKPQAYDAMFNALVGDGESTNPVFATIVLGSLAAIIVTALLAGLALMLMRTPKEGDNRRMPAVALLVTYFATATGLAYLAYVMDDFAGSDTFLGSLSYAQRPVLILFPVLAILAYGLLRALQSRFGRVRRSSPLTFIATLRYGMAFTTGLFTVVYICLLLATVHYGVRADAAARQSMVTEAAFIRSCFK